MHIYIPTLGRPNKQETLKHIPNKLMEKVRLVVNKEEYGMYCERVSKKMLMVVEKKVTNIGQVRQYIIENSLNDFSLFFDDDMSFGVRKEGKLKKAEKIDVYGMYKLLLSWLEEGIAHVGVSQRFGNNRITEDYLEVTRMNNVYAYNTKIVNKEKIRFDRLPIMEDFDMTLSLLAAGYKNRVSYKYCWGQGKSGDRGGCSTYRTSEMQKEAAIALSKLHPGIVKIKAKKGKEEWGGINSLYRTDVNILWKKAFKEKERKGSMDWLFSGGKK